MGRLTYEDKVSIISDSTPRKNKATAEDFNEIKASVNALYDNVELSTDEQEIGKYLGKTLYRKTIIIDKSQMTINNGLYNYDTTPLGAKEVFVDFSHTYLENIITGDNEEKINTHYMANSTLMSNATNYSNFRNYSFFICLADREVVEMFIGTSLQTLFTSLHLTLEYTKE